ncbi:globin [Croceicoccus estronivorus]|uniref:group II truncated hemoglobin n=1 Tax=Croceicoccus estronivorus TaxID=1172626 RepID=UPI0008328E89|nr:group II truncated hemoglobin [Croceicoccus estronivorus]OCC24017.1 globin [Croceicoccus estronivorus]
MASQAQSQATPFELLGGHPTIERIVERFYDLMEEDPAYAELRALHAPDLTPMRRSLALFLAAWCGGPRDWFDENPGKCMMSAHKGIAINRQVAEQWADAMGRAIADCGPDDQKLGAEMAEMLSRMARSMGR